MSSRKEDDMRVWRCQRCGSNYLKFIELNRIDCAVEGCEAKHTVTEEGLLVLKEEEVK